MKSIYLAGATALGLVLAGCATSATTPVAVQTLAPDQISALHLKSVTADAAPGVAMTPQDFDRVCAKVKAQVEAASPGIFVDPASSEAPNASTISLHFTQYDGGNAFARFMLIGLGQIHVDADVNVVDAIGTAKGQYKISKQFALGGIAGGMTRIEDVEDGFAKSVAEIFKKPK